MQHPRSAMKKIGLAGVRLKNFSFWKKIKPPPLRYVPPHIHRPWYVLRDAPKLVLPPPPKPIHYKTSQELETMTRTCQLAGFIRQYAGSLVRPGISTDEIDHLVHEKIIELGAYPSPLGYAGFPKSIATSVNDVICHGIPDKRPLEEGDIITIDVTVYKDGYHGDCAATFPVGKISEEKQRLVQAAKEATLAGIKVCGPGVTVPQISSAIEQVASKYGYDLVRDFTGHGIGKEFHETAIIIPPCSSPNIPTLTLKPGMVFTVEPVLVEGDQAWSMWDDGWTIVSRDGSWSSQFEETVAIVDDGVRILTELKTQ